MTFLPAPAASFGLPGAASVPAPQLQMPPADALARRVRRPKKIAAGVGGKRRAARLAAVRSWVPEEPGQVPR
jgi:hypothetical protein